MDESKNVAVNRRVLGHVSQISEEPNFIEVREVDVQEIIDHMELGWFHYRLLIICGLGFMADSMVWSVVTRL